jgi:hypothetical protein
MCKGFKERVILDGLHDPDAYEQVFDILDVWFDSGSTHAFVLRDRPDGTEDGIADLYLEGTDQHRGWFHSSMLQACATKGRAPYRGVLTHGFTLDEKGMKMSKSLGNTVAPEAGDRQYGADILRLWVAQSDYTADLRIGPEILKGVADSYRRLRNTHALHAGQPRRLGRRPSGWRRPRCPNWNAGCCTGWPNWTPRCARAMPPTISRACSRSCSQFAPRTCRPSISTSARMRSIATRRQPAPARGAHGARHPVPPADDLAGAGAGVHDGGCLGGALSPARRSLRASAGHAATPADWRDEPLAAKWAGIRRCAGW